MNRIVTFLALLICLNSAFVMEAQIPFMWQAEDVPSCEAGRTITSIKDFTASSQGCTDVELIGRNTLNFTTTGRDSNYPTTTILINRMRNNLNVLLGDESTAGSLVLDIDGNLDDLNIYQSSIALSYSNNHLLFPSIRLSFDEIINGNSDCDVFLPGGTILNIETIYLFYNDSWVEGTPVELSFSYTYSRSPVIILPEVVVPDSSEDTRTSVFNYNLPMGNVYFNPVRYGIPIRLETNTPYQRQINLFKEGGFVAFSKDIEFEVEEAYLSQQQHLVKYNFSNVDFCLGRNEVYFDTTATLVLDNSLITYSDRQACLMFYNGSTLIIPENGFQRIGNKGYGLHAWRPGSRTEVRENATLVLDNIFEDNYEYRDAQVSHIEVFAGGHIEVTENTSAKIHSLRESGRPENFYDVTLHEGATFDMSAAPIEVQRLFIVNGVSRSEDVLNASDYSVFPNPTSESSTFVKTSQTGIQLQSIEVIDLSGRVLSQNSSLQGERQHAVELPSTGMFVLRLTDVEGRVGHTRVVRQ